MVAGAAPALAAWRSGGESQKQEAAEAALAKGCTVEGGTSETVGRQDSLPRPVCLPGAQGQARPCPRGLAGAERRAEMTALGEADGKFGRGDARGGDRRRKEGGGEEKQWKEIKEGTPVTARDDGAE